MKGFLPLVILPLCLSTSLLISAPLMAEELPYSELIAKAENYLIPDEKKIVYEGAAIVLFHRAAKAAPDEGKKLEALLRAGYAEELMKQYPSAIESYQEAVALQSPAPVQKQRAQLALALAKYQLTKQKKLLTSAEADEIRSALEATLQPATLTAGSQRQAREAIADIYANRSGALAAVGQYQKLLALPALSTEDRRSYLALALEQLTKAPASPEALALLNSLAPQYLVLLDKPADIAQAKSRWANGLELQNASPAALAKWTEITNDATMPEAQRTSALWRIIELHRKQKNYAAALTAASRWSTLEATPKGTFWKHRERARIFQEQKDEANVRAEWKALIALPQTNPQDRGTAWTSVANSFKRERVASPGNTALFEGEKNAYLAIWKIDGVKINERADAMINAAQMEVDAKHADVAAKLLMDGVEASKAFEISAADKRDLQQILYYAIAQTHRSVKQYAQALASLILAQGNSQWNDPRPGELAVTLFQESIAAKDWSAARNNILALRTVWNLEPKKYFFNLAQMEINAQNWPAAKVALDEFDKLLPTAAEKKDADLLRAMLPALP